MGLFRCGGTFKYLTVNYQCVSADTSAPPVVPPAPPPPAPPSTDCSPLQMTMYTRCVTDCTGCATSTTTILVAQCTLPAGGTAAASIQSICVAAAGGDACTEGANLVDSGVVAHDGGYLNNEDCRWMLTCSSQSPTLSFETFETESNFDFVSCFAPVLCFATGTPIWCKFWGENHRHNSVDGHVPNLAGQRI